jgi:hypothetical protein
MISRGRSSNTHVVPLIGLGGVPPYVAVTVEGPQVAAGHGNALHGGRDVVGVGIMLEERVGGEDRDKGVAVVVKVVYATCVKQDGTHGVVSCDLLGITTTRRDPWRRCESGLVVDGLLSQSQYKNTGG